MPKFLGFLLAFFLACGLAFGASTATVYDTDTKLMLHMDGADASTTFTDSSAGAKAVTASGDAQIDTAQKEFGTASGLFDGTGDFLTLADSADWDLGSGNFTVDFWVRFSATTGNQTVFSQRGASGTTAYNLSYIDGTGVRFNFSANGTNVTSVDNAWSPSADTWYHIAFVRNGNTGTVYIGGVAQGTTADFTGVTIFNSGEKLKLGALGADGSETNLLTGWIDEFRFVKGTAVWTEGFTPPTAPYLRSGRRIITT